MSNDKIVLGIVAGAAIGAALGVLFAPDKGSNTRRKIADRRDTYVAELECKFNDFVGTVTDKFDAMKQQAAHLMENGKAVMHDTQSKSGTVVK